MKIVTFIIIVLSTLLNFSVEQDCGTLGERCVDDKQCCGGWCINDVCTQTYENCQFVEYPCLDEYCPPGFECYMFKPSAFCVGCELQRACRPFNDSGSSYTVVKSNVHLSQESEKTSNTVVTNTTVSQYNSSQSSYKARSLLQLIILQFCFIKMFV